MGALYYIEQLLFTIVMALLSGYILYIYVNTFLTSESETQNNSKVMWCSYVIWQALAILEAINLPNYITLIINVLFVYIICDRYKGKRFKKCFLTFIYISIWLLTELLIGYIFIAINLNLSKFELIGSLISKLLLYSLVKVLCVIFRLENIKTLPDFQSIVLLIIPVGSIFVSYNSFIISGDGYQPGHVLRPFASLVLLLIINFVMFKVYIKLVEFYDFKNKALAYKQQLEMYSKNMEEKNNFIKEFRKMRHDFKNQLIYLSELCKDRNNSQLSSIINAMLEKSSFDQIMISQTDNPAIDSIVNFKYALANSNSISFDYNCNVPVALKCEDVDLCIILGNLLDNAIEANLNNAVINKYIRLVIEYNNNNLIISCNNSYKGQIKRNSDGKITTIKESALIHGIGLESIESTVNKYHGFLDIYFDESNFIVDIILYNI